MITVALKLVAGKRAPKNVVFSARKGLRNEPARRWLSLYAGIPLIDGLDRVEVAFELILRKAISPALRVQVVK